MGMAAAALDSLIGWPLLGSEGGIWLLNDQC